MSDWGSASLVSPLEGKSDGAVGGRKLTRRQLLVEVTMPAFPIVDAHLHLWDITRLRYPWLEGIPSLNRTFLLEDFNRACESIGVDEVVFLQCECDPDQYLEEVRWVASLAQCDSRLSGIISYAPLERGVAVADELAALAEQKLVKGIRRIIQFEPDPEFCLRPDFIQGVCLLPEFGWTFDICISQAQMASTIRFVAQCPDVRFVLDHIGKPDIRNHRQEPWRTELRELSRFPNVHCKVSSLATEADHRCWTEEDLRPFVDHVFDCFGFDRTFFGGDWPVSSQAASYSQCVATLEGLIGRVSEGEARKLFRENAIAFYRLEIS